SSKRTSRIIPPPSAVIIPNVMTPTMSSRATRAAVKAPLSAKAKVPSKSSSNRNSSVLIFTLPCSSMHTKHALRLCSTTQNCLNSQARPGIALLSARSQGETTADRRGCCYVDYTQPVATTGVLPSVSTCTVGYITHFVLCALLSAGNHTPLVEPL